MDPFGFTAPATIKVLVLPIGNVPENVYSQVLHLIQAARDIRLLDLQPLDTCRLFNPQQFPQGRVFLDLAPHGPEDESSYLHDFEPFRKTWIVIGIIAWDAEFRPQNEIKRLKDLYPSALVHQCIYLHAPKEVNNADPDVYFLSQKPPLTALEAIMCSVVGRFLVSLDAFASLFENISLQSPASLVDSHTLARTINYAQKRLSSHSQYKASFVNGQELGVSAISENKTKSLQKQIGRQAKIMGNFYLLAGRAPEAVKYFVEAAVNARKSDDPLWLASALEGLAVSCVVLRYLDLPFLLQNPVLTQILYSVKPKLLFSVSRLSSESFGRSPAFSPRSSTSSVNVTALNTTASNASAQEVDSLPFSEFLKLVALRITQFYLLSAADLENSVPDVVFVELVIRSAKLMVALHLGGASPRNVAAALLENSAITKSEGLCVSKSEIVHELENVFTTQLIDLNFVHQCKVYCALASIYEDLELHRKQAFVLRLLLISILPKLPRIERTGVLPGAASAVSIRAIFHTLFKAYRINTESEIDSFLAATHRNDWITIQLQLIKICLRIAEALKDYETLAQLCILTFTRFSHCLPNQDQLKLRSKLEWLAYMPGANLLLPHPDMFMVRRIQLVPPANSDVHLVDEPDTNDTTFRPANKAAKTKIPLLFVGDTSQLKISVQNPFVFDFDLLALEIVASEPDQIQTIGSYLKRGPVTPFGQHAPENWNARPGETTTSVQLPAESMTQIFVSVKTIKAGQVTIKGINARIGRGDPQFFPIIDRELSVPTHKQKPTLTLQVDLLAKLMQNLTLGNAGSRATTLCLSLSVAPVQPTLEIVENLITNNSIMLLEGERRAYSLRLRSSSDESINFLSFSSWDSTIDALTSKLNSAPSYPSEDVYELEWLVLRNKAITVRNREAIASKYEVILPDQDLDLQYEILGKRGMTELKLILEYGNRNKEKNGEKGDIIKTVSLNIAVTVRPALEVAVCDLVPFVSSTNYEQFDISSDCVNSQSNIHLLFDFVRNARASDNLSSYCLLVLDIRNLWKLPLEVTISKSYAKSSYKVTQSVGAARTTRFLLPIMRLSLPDAEKPIPSLRDKQIVKNTTITEAEANERYRRFWVKEALLAGLVGSWKSTGDHFERSGTIDFRCIRLDSAMTRALLHDAVLVQQVLVDEHGETVEKKDSDYVVERETLYILITRICNHGSSKIGGMLRYLPYPTCASVKLDLAIDQKILYNGVLQKPVSVGAGSTVEDQMGFMVLECGRYEWGTYVDVRDGQRAASPEPVLIRAI